MKVIYDGTSDFQEFSAADFKQAGVEGKKTSFPKGKEVEVPDEVGEALIADHGLFAGHVFVKPEEEEVPNVDQAVEADSDNIISQGDSDTPADSASTGAGTSAGGTTGTRARARRSTT